MKTKSRLLAFIMVMAMALSMLSVTALAAEDAAPVDAPQEYSDTFFSLMPLEEKNVTIDMTGKLPAELKAVSAKSVIDAVNAALPTDPIPEDADIAWTYSNEDSYKKLDRAGTIDLMGDSTSRSSRTLELIVGKFDQLNQTNIRYIVNIQLTPISELFAEDQGTSVLDASGKAVKVFRSYNYISSRTDGSYGGYVDIVVDKDGWDDESSSTVTLTLNEALSQFKDLTVKFYKGRYNSPAAVTAAGAEDVTAKLLSTDPAAGVTVTSTTSDNYYTAVFTRGGEAVWSAYFYISVYPAGSSVYTYRLTSGNTEDSSFSYRTSTSWGDDMETYTLSVSKGHAANATYYLTMSYNNDDPDVSSGRDGVTKAVVGKYDTLEAAASAADIKDQLITTYSSSDTGYGADFSGGVTFTVFGKSGDVIHFKVIVKEGAAEVAKEDPLSSDTYFGVNSAYDADGSRLDTYVMPYEDDGYYFNGFQTVFVLDGSQPYDGGKIVPSFYTGDEVHVYAGLDKDGTSPDIQESGKTSVTFQSGEPVHYSAAAENGTHLKNYWVTFLTQQTGGSKLFVNGINDTTSYQDGMPVRVVKLVPSYGDHHDVFIANIGDEPLTNLSVTLEGAQNVRLDDYWTIGETKTLNAFDSTSRTKSHGELDNVAKIRLLRDVDAQGNEVSGPISGTLVISADGNETVRIKLTGIAGDPTITTSSLKAGVKWVPYSTVIQTNSIGDADAVQFSLVEGTLPSGVELRPNGEIYGVAQETGSFPITVRAAYKDFPDVNNERSFVLTIKENTNENVWNETDETYDISTAIPNQDGTLTIDTMQTQGNSWRNDNMLFVSQGQFKYFIDLWLDGKKLVEGVDYIKNEGSTRITISTQTLGGDGNDQDTHTIAMEFREGDPVTGTLKRAAQNYTAAKVTGGRRPLAPVTPTVSGPSGVFKQEGNSVIYIVAKGDTLQEIAQAAYGNHRYWSYIYFANQSTIKATNLIYINQVLVIPQIPGVPFIAKITK